MPDPTRDFPPHGRPTVADAPDAATPAPGSSTLDSASAPAPAATPTGLQGYELLEVIGRGGMGTVYRARDVSLNRDVAVKVLQDKFAPGSLAAKRFTEEAQITGQLQHPGIPPVHQIGTLADGRPFLVMKLVKGRTLAEIFAEGSANHGALLAAFEQLCQAVAYAHARGIIHRDLKPANVMVGAFAEVQVMDWGLAKFRTDARADSAEAATASTFFDPRDDTDESLRTKTGAILGTPAFMSPEQAIGAIDQIDERSDVFGLGAVLCAILTGQPPFLGDTAESTRRLAAQGKLSEAFARLDSCGAEPDLVALSKRCLAAEKESRPRNAGEVHAAVAGLRAAAEEQVRRLELERAAVQIQAAEQRKRRRVLAAATAVVFVALAAAAGVSIWQAQVARTEATNARKAEDTAREEAENARKAEAAATAARTAEEQERQTADEALNFMKRVLAFGTSAGQGGKDPKKDPTVRNALDRATRFIDKPDKPLPPPLEAKLRRTLGEMYFRLQAPEEAAAQYRRALDICLVTPGPDSELTWQTMNDLGEVYKRLKRFDEAEDLLKRALASKRAKLGNDNRSTQRTVNNLGGLYRELKRYDDAEPLVREAYEARRRLFGPDDSDTLNSTNNLGALYMRRDRPAEAEPYFRQAAEGYERTQGIMFATAQCWSNVADAILAQKRFADAVPVYQKALGILDRIPPEEGRGLRSQIVGQLHKLYTEWGQPEEAAKWAPKEPTAAPPPREMKG